MKTTSTTSTTTTDKGGRRRRRNWPHIPKTRRWTERRLLLLNPAKRSGRWHRVKRPDTTKSTRTMITRWHHPLVRSSSITRRYHVKLNLPLHPGRFHRPRIHSVEDLFQLCFGHGFQHRPIVLFQLLVLPKRFKHASVISRSRFRCSCRPSEFFGRRIAA